jgi:ASC-1-like (ASCH) protein
LSLSQSCRSLALSKQPSIEQINRSIDDDLTIYETRQDKAKRRQKDQLKNIKLKAQVWNRKVDNMKSFTSLEAPLKRITPSEQTLEVRALDYMAKLYKSNQRTNKLERERQLTIDVEKQKR